VAAEPTFRRLAAARDAGLHAAFAVPVVAGEEVVAVLEFFLDEQRPVDHALLGFVGAVAAQLATALLRRRAEDALRASEARFRSITESSADAIVLADAAGRIVGWKPAAEAMFG